MENVLVAIILVFLLLFAVGTLTEASLEAQTVTAEAWQEAAARMDDQAHTAISPVTATSVDGTSIQWIIENSGSIPLADYDRWDVILHYYDISGTYHVDYLPYSTSLTAAHWTVTNLFLLDSTPEIYNRGVFDPQEQAHIDIPLLTAIQPNSAVQLNIAPANGAAISAQFIYNVP